MADLYAIGPEALDEWEMEPVKSLDGIEWLVYWYDYKSYEGHGLAVAKRRDGTFCWHDMGHCSCYGPFEKWPDGCGDEADLRHALGYDEDVRRRRSPDDYDYAWVHAVECKVSELLGWLPPECGRREDGDG